MSAPVTAAKRGLLENAFSSPKWNSRITSANTTRKEMWLGYVLGPYGMLVGQSIFCFVFKIENDMPVISKELQARKVAECAKLGIEYIPADELQRREVAEQERIAEENRVKELKEKCAKQGLDFDKENQKVLDKRAAKAAKAAAKAAKRAKK